MISRVADHCFWLGRYLERAESTARVLDATRGLGLDAGLSPEQCWLPVIIVSGEREHFVAKYGPLSGADASKLSEIVEGYMTFDEENLTSIANSVAAARESARSVREVLSLDAWEIVNELYLWLAGPEARRDYEADRHGFYQRIRRGVQLCLGLCRSTMLIDEPLDFLWLGVLLERTGQTARVLDVHHHAFTNLPSHHQVVETALWLALLRACSGFEAFMKRAQGKVSGGAVAAFLLLEPNFPRSIRYSVHEGFVRFFLQLRPADQPSLPGAATAARFAALDAWLGGLSAQAIEQGRVHEILTHVVDETAAICNDLARELFGYGPPAVMTQAQAQG
jgi:uncharacterized alpha-E superfamily protein